VFAAVGREFEIDLRAVALGSTDTIQDPEEGVSESARGTTTRTR
jgi:hypothetical protein